RQSNELCTGHPRGCLWHRRPPGKAGGLACWCPLINDHRSPKCLAPGFAGGPSVPPPAAPLLQFTALTSRAGGRGHPVATSWNLNMELLKPPGGVRYGVYGDNPSSPAPTVIGMAGSFEHVLELPDYSGCGTRLAERGCVFVGVGLPAYGDDIQPGD